MNIAEHKLNIFHQLDNLPEESLIELEQIISTLKTNNALKVGDRFDFTPKPKSQNLKTLLASWSPLEEEFPEIQDKPPWAEVFF
ncbi:MAG: hypothetical protein CTY16_01445 [Methylobacter sp.]|nr:MAG: hypothetical protein CTY16_01445 [Methylobacter sp.]